MERATHDDDAQQQRLVARRCALKYTRADRDRLRAALRRRPSLTVGIAALLRNAAPILPAWSRAVLDVLLMLPRPRQSMVSVLESRSTDATALHLHRLGTALSARGIPHAIRTGAVVDAAPFVRGGSTHRIDFLARLRNLVLEPVLAARLDGGAAVERILFLNDVVACGGDLARLLLHRADAACGYDFQPRREFWDNWVMDFGDAADEAAHRRCVLDRSRPPSTAPCTGAAEEAPQPVNCCWNGAIAVRAEAFWRHGVRFRRAPPAPAECTQSECSTFCLDLRRAGLHRILVDPTVQVGYSPRAFLDAARRRAGPVVPTPIAFPLANATLTWRCCELLEPGREYVDFARCHSQRLRPAPSSSCKNCGTTASAPGMQ